MKFGGIAAAVVFAWLAARGQLRITSVGPAGDAQWQLPHAPSTCHVEWASSPGGPWYRNWDSLQGLVVTTATGSAAVPMFFRIAQPLTWAEDGLVFWMPCDGDFLDHSHHANHPTTAGAIEFQADRGGHPSHALRLDLGEYLTVPAAPSLVLTNLTVALWARFDNFNAQPYLMAMGPYNTAWSFMIQQSDLTPNSGWPYGRGGAATPQVALQQKLEINRWYHLAMTIRGTEATLYLDGAPRKTGTVAAVGTAIDRMVIGRTPQNHASPTNWFFAGSLDDVRVYSRALDATEIGGLHDLAQ